jgi:hypothetical protein
MRTTTANWRGNRVAKRAAAAAIASVCALILAPAAANAESFFAATGSMATSRTAAMAAPLPGGDVLVAGGWRYSAPYDHNGGGLKSAEVYDSASGEFTATGTMTESRIGAAIAPLADGRVLIAGGLQAPMASKPYASAEIYDPETGEFTTTGSMAIGRWEPVAAPLPDGRILVAGGGNVGYDPATETHTATFASAEIYDPETGEFSPAGSLSTARVGAGAAALPDGRVLVAGGSWLASAEVYDPASGEFSSTGALTRAMNGPAAALGDGSILVFGTTGPAQTTIDRYDPSTASFSALAVTAPARDSMAVAPLPGGRVLVAGGSAGGGYAGISAAAEIFVVDPAEAAAQAPATSAEPGAEDGASETSAAAPTGAASGTESPADAGPAATVPSTSAAAIAAKRTCKRNARAGRHHAGQHRRAACGRAASKARRPGA